MKTNCEHYQGQCLTETDLSREIARVSAHDPCIMTGCVHEYGHAGQHEYDHERQPQAPAAAHGLTC